MSSKDKESTNIYKTQNILNIKNPSLRYACFTCLKDISKYTAIISNHNFFCVGCFAKLQSYQNYSIMPRLNFTIFQNQWIVRQQLLLIQGIQKYSFGNWKQITSHIDSHKSQEQVKNHFLKYYTQIQPPLLHCQYKKKRQRQCKSKKQQEDQQQVNEQKNIQKNTLMKYIGYNNKRKQFQVQYDNQAQNIIANLVFQNTDLDEQIDMKFRILQIYNRRLQERIKRRNFVIQRSLFNINQINQKQSNRIKQQKEISAIMRPFARFQTHDQHQILIEQLVKQKNIRNIIQKLKICKQKGLKTLQQVDIYLKNMKKKSNQKKRNQRSTSKDSINKSLNLHSSQIQLCFQIDLSLQNYAIIKKAIIQQSLKKKFISKQYISKLFQLQESIIFSIIKKLVQLDIIIQPR